MTLLNLILQKPNSSHQYTPIVFETTDIITKNDTVDFAQLTIL